MSTQPEIKAGDLLTLKSGSRIEVRAIIDGVAYIRRPDGKFPRAVRLDSIKVR